MAIRSMVHDVAPAWLFSFSCINLIIPLVLYFLTSETFIECTTEVLRPRGVPLSKKIFYEPTKDFSCIDGSGTFPFHFVNDDFCDCADGSDEPGTAACPNGMFHCINAAYVSHDIPSSRVNDQICDCCDGSDEYNSTADCLNTCHELGRRAREEAEKQQELYQRGYSLWKEYSQHGKRIKEENKAKLEQLKAVEEETEKIKNEKEAIKNEAEEKEKSVLSKYETEKEEKKKEVEELEMMKHQQEEQINAEDAFHDLDINQDGLLSYQELQQFSKFDSDRDGTVSDEEAKFFLHMKEEMELDEFTTTGWMIMKPVYMMDKLTPAPQPVAEPPPMHDIKRKEKEDQREKEEEQDFQEIQTGEAADVQEDHYDDAEEEDDDDDLDPTPPDIFKKDHEEDGTPNETKEETQYDEETQKIIDAAKHARDEFNEASKNLQNVKNEIRDVQENVEGDFGPEEEFASLKGQCFDFSDREYTYRFCPFDRASQIPKSGGSDISLGKWGSWFGPEEYRYSKMKFDNGMVCWNGPSRSVVVNLQCGIENKLLSSSEPNRCEYLFEFTTPALCSSAPGEIPRTHDHSEL